MSFPKNTQFEFGDDGSIVDPYEKYKTHSPAINKAISYLLFEKSGSKGSIDKLKNDIQKFAHYCNKTPDELITMEKKQLDMQIREFLITIENKDSANSMIPTMKRFFRENGRDDLRYPHFFSPSRKETKNLPITLEDAFKMIRFATSPQVKLMILLLLSSGLRVSTMLALRFGIVESKNPYLKKFTLLQEIEQNKRNPAIIIFPKMKELVENACKGHIPYFTFMSKEAGERLQDHHKWLMHSYGQVKKDDVLFPSKDRKLSQEKYRKIPMTTSAVNIMLKEVAKKAGISGAEKISSRSFRKLYQDILKKQGKNAGLSQEDREYLMGHVLPKPVENYYTPDKIEETRQKYARIQFNPHYHSGIYEDLQHVSTFFDISYDHLLEETVKRYGKNPEKHLIKNTLKEFLRNSIRQKIIKQDELEDYLNRGYRFIDKVDLENIIVEIDHISNIVKTKQDGENELMK